MATIQMRKRWNQFWFSPVPLARVAVFRIVIYLYLIVDVIFTRWHLEHGYLPKSWYEPLWIGRHLHIPAPTSEGMTIVMISIVVLSVVAAAGKGRRTAGPAIALLYFYWVYIGFTYGKVDHDRTALLVALAVLPTVRWTGVRNQIEDAGAGWMLRAVQVAVVLVYLFAAVTKMRETGIAWVTGTILVSAIVRRGTMFADPLLNYPWVLHFIQGFTLFFEFTSPIMLFRNRLGRFYVLTAFLFHMTSFALITISFRSHVVCLLAFVPLERVVERVLTPFGVFRRGVPAGAKP
jgi:vitamin K-dependent gamma-carboxylase-like protein